MSPPDQTAAGHRCRAVALSPDGLAGSSSFVSGGRHHGPRAVGTGSRLPQPQPARPARATRGPSFRRRPAWTPRRWALPPCAPSLQHPPRPASNAYSFSNTHLRRVLLQEAHLDSPPPSLGAVSRGKILASLLPSCVTSGRPLSFSELVYPSQCRPPGGCRPQCLR